MLGGWATVYQVDSYVGQTVEPGFAVNTTNGLQSLNPNLVTITHRERSRPASMRVRRPA